MSWQRRTPHARYARMRRTGMVPMAGMLTVLALALGACGLSSSTGGNGVVAGGSGGPVSYDQAPGHIVAQLVPQPGFVFPPYNGIPQWTLYGDGTLIYTNGTGGPGLAPGSSTLMQAKLSPDQVEQILNVVVTQHHVFSATHAPYGRPMPDAGTTLLNVDANGRHAQLNLSGSEGQNPDAQTQDVFAIERYLLSYKPENPQPYTPPGVAVLVLPVATGATDGPAPVVWPYTDVNLAQAQARECPLVNAGAYCPAQINGTPGILAIYGQRGQSLLAQLGRGAIVSQNGQSYRLMLWPLLPDAAQTGAGTAPAVRVATGGSIASWPLYAA